MITSLEQVKLVTNKVTVTTYDTAFEAQIPIVAELLCEYSKSNYISVGESIYNTSKGYETWTSSNVSASGEMIFDATGKTITSTTSIFGDFKVGDNIVIMNSTRNQGYYTITNVTDTVITVDEDVKDDTDTVDIYLVDFPKSVSYIAARMVGWDVIKRNKAIGVDSVRIGTYSIKYKDIGGSMYPLDIVNGLIRYHRGK